ncbi:MAG: hypothetical protein ACI4QI_07440 [Candidatus Coproplasma sp.]
MSEGTYLYTLTKETRQLDSYEWKVEEVLYDDALVEKFMEQANTYYLVHTYRDYYEGYYNNKTKIKVDIRHENLLIDEGQLIGFYIEGKYLLLSEANGGKVILRWECTSHGDSDSGVEEYVYIYTAEYANSHMYLIV